jgi:cyanophycinase-like exopeptidase
LRTPTILIAGKFGSRHFGARPFLDDALRATKKPAPLVLYVGAASGDDPGFGRALSALLRSAGAQRVLWPKLTGKQPNRADARAALGEADLVFIGGGDVHAGIRALREADLVGDVRAAAARGTAFCGMSAGAIMLGERWIRWPRDDAGDDEAETYECLGLVPCAVDTHGEADGWREAQSFAAVRARELGKRARAYGIPSGGALVANGQGSIEARAVPVPVFVAAPRRRARLERTLEVLP